MLLLFFISLSAASHHLPQLTATSLWLKESCLISLGPEVHEVSKALLCGERITSSNFKNLLQNFGLIHLFVISGAHFLFLERYLNRLKLHWLPVSLMLVLFAMSSGLGAPILRSGLQLGLLHLSRQLKLHWNTGMLQMFAGGLSLLWVPSDSHLSLQLSWGASLLLSLGSKDQSLWIAPFLIWLGLLPLLSGLNLPSPFSIGANLIAGPIFQFFFFPFCWVDQALFEGRNFQLLLDKMVHFSPYTISQKLTSGLAPPHFRWSYLFALQCYAYFYHRSFYHRSFYHRSLYRRRRT